MTTTFAAMEKGKTMRLIDADKVEKEWKGQLTATYQDDYGKGFQAGLIVAVRQPTVDAEPVRHGHWKYFHKQNKAVCTNCSFERDLDVDFGRAISCPNCWAKMDDKQN